ncbi:MAG: bifunctional pyr operon transcriptional regulator/uracil phosphoribosyltransferase PyrR [Candidatus Omnitrophica bacterium]|nr:bifunctional pyr operon transcriptional regulator/uracil phosphoribosyltransferase PyrR [Candidatus Omnitrophota bacterium]MCM8777799.1 bifunctional pyr operon transcriptional regulator/uracil phosphoribosyltransferase PyrR [Candidatus Omnitrophota bacterium]
MKKIISAREMEYIIKELATSIKKELGMKDIAIVGIRRRGALLADRIKRYLGVKDVPIGYLDITFYRDDFSTVGAHPVISETEVLFDIDGKKVLLVDDVLFTGRTVRAALDALTDMGRPALVKLFVLIDRGHRELPISADFVGKAINTKKSEMVEVKMKEIDGVDEVLVVDKK